MTTCVLCHFTTVPDDIVLSGPRGQVVCLRCYCRETGTTLRMSRLLHHQITATLDALDAATPAAAELWT